MSGAAASSTGEMEAAATRHERAADLPSLSAKKVTPLQVHLVSLVLGAAVLVYVDRNVWFFGDDWEFLLDRGLLHPARSIWLPHNEHWSTLPILVFRAAVSINGMHSIAPTLAVLLLAHLGICHLLWRISLRAGVDPWMATALTSIFVVLGSGAENLTWDFQMGFVGSVLFGLLAIQVDRLRTGPAVRLVLTWIALVCSLMCSGIGITMTAACTVDRALRAGLRRAALTVVVPAAVYIVWYVQVGRTGLRSDHITIASVLALPGYLWTGLSAALGNSVGFADAGPVLVVGLVGWAILNAYRRRTGQATPLALGGATVILFIVIGLVRVELGTAEATASRYTYIAVALLLPVIGLALSDLNRRSGDGGKPVIYGLLAIVVIANLGTLRSAADARAAEDTATKAEVLASAHVLLDGDKILTTSPQIPLDPNITSASLLQVARAGQLPHEALSPASIVTAQSRLDISLTPKRVFSRSLIGPPFPAHESCATAGLIPVSVPKGGGSLVLKSTLPLTLGITLRGVGGASAPVVDVSFPAGELAVNISASDTKASLQASAAPGFTYCSSTRQT